MASFLRRSEFFTNLPPPAECLAILVGCAELFAFGLAGLANPSDFAAGLGVPIDAPGPLADHETPPATEAQKTQIGLTQAIAARNAAHGALILTFACYLRDRRALGCAVAVGFVTTVADFLIVRAYGDRRNAGVHALGAVNTVLLGGSLLCWERGEKFWKF